MVEMSITFEDVSRNRKWTYGHCTDIHFNDRFVDVKVEDSTGTYWFRVFNYEYAECHIEFSQLNSDE